MCVCAHCDSGDLFFLGHNNVEIHKLYCNIKIKVLRWQRTEESEKITKYCRRKCVVFGILYSQ